jgi:hypothetical protein
MRKQECREEENKRAEKRVEFAEEICSEKKNRQERQEKRER